MKRTLLIFLATMTVIGAFAQNPNLSIYTDLRSALKNPKKVVGLDLSHSSIEGLEKALPFFVNLEYLNLSDKRLTKVPSSISELPKLQFLDLSGNDFVLLPEQLSNASSLREIRLDRQLKMDKKQVLEVLARLPALTALSLRSDSIQTLPPTIGKLTGLQSLNLGGNPIAELPESMLKLENLNEIYLDGDTKLDLKQALSVLGKLPDLQVLHLEDNQLKALPENMRDLKQLKELYLARNSIRSLKIDLEQSKQLDYLDVQGNPMNNEVQQYLNRTGVRIKF